MKFGRRRPLARGPRLRLANYLPGMPVSPPPTCDYSAAAIASLGNILGNDELGDCVVAGAYHIVGVATGNAGALYVPTLEQVVADYSKISGYVPGDPSTDIGCDPVVATNFWMHQGFANGTKLTGALEIDPSNEVEVQVATYLFENIYPGFELPDAWVNPMPSGPGFLWDVAGPPVPDNGHQVMACGYGPAGVTVCTWGMLGTLTYRGLAKYAAASANGDCYVLLTTDIINRAIGKAPNGLDWATLVGDFDAIGGHVAPVVVPPPPPSPGPPPAPTPTPPMRVTLAEAKQWASQGLEVGWPKP